MSIAEATAVAEVLPEEPKAPPEPIDVGDWVWVVYWRPFPMGADKHNGSWESAPSRVISLSRSGVVCHEVTNKGAAPDDAGNPESFLRWTRPERVFRTPAEADEARRTLKNPNH